MGEDIKMLLLVYLANSLTLKMETVCFSETSVNFCQTIVPHIPEDSTHQ
jgi:hypothetical protein